MAEQAQTDPRITALQTHLEKEIAQISSHAEWYKEHSQRTKRKYHVIRVPIIVLGILLPQLIAVQMVGPNGNLSVATFITASVVAVLMGLDAFFRYGELWVEERGAELALYALKRKYRREMLRIELAPSPDKAIEIAETVIDSLRVEYEQVVGETVGTFVKRAKESASSQPTLRVSG